MLFHGIMFLLIPICLTCFTCHVDNAHRHALAFVLIWLLLTLGSFSLAILANYVVSWYHISVNFILPDLFHLPRG
jgi:hypothetical protein